VARALINQPNLILADEPTGNLDEVNEAVVMGLFTELHREGHTILMVTHDPEIGRMAERRIELHHGKLTDVSVFPAGEEELIDNLLKAVWKAREENGGRPLVADQLPAYVRNRATFLLMAQEELVRTEGGVLTMSAQGEARARSVIRRHRLAERLFFNTFGLEEELLDSNACRIEHTLGPEVVEKLCSFLHHPETCPHGSPIPRGACCPARQ
jgi:energy-coupling factor transporter ATP-binding protein EcfA2